MDEAEADSAKEFTETRQDVSPGQEHPRLHRAGGDCAHQQPARQSCRVRVPGWRRLSCRRRSSRPPSASTTADPPPSPTRSRPCRHRRGVYAALAVTIVALVATPVSGPADPSPIQCGHPRRTDGHRRRVDVVARLGLTSVAITHSARENGADPLRDLTSARIATQQARSAETLSFVQRGDTEGLRDVQSGHAADPTHPHHAAKRPPRRRRGHTQSTRCHPRPAGPVDRRRQRRTHGDRKRRLLESAEDHRHRHVGQAVRSTRRRPRQRHHRHPRIVPHRHQHRAARHRLHGNGNAHRLLRHTGRHRRVGSPIREYR